MEQQLIVLYIKFISKENINHPKTKIFLNFH